MDTENLEAAIYSLVEKLNGIGIEIYHLNSSISSLKESVNMLSKERE